jgi:hypothetical protein
MRSGMIKFIVRSVMGVLASCLLFINASRADLTTAQLAADEAAFLANPAQFLSTNFQNGGNDLAAVIQALAADPANLNTIINALANANPSQQNAIGQGLGAEAKAVQQSNPNYASQIQTAVANAGSTQASSGYTSGTGGTQIGSAGGGGGGGGGGIGGPIGNGPPSGGSGGGSAGTGGSSQTTTQGNSLSGGSVGGGGSGGGTGTLASSTSPF